MIVWKSGISTRENYCATRSRIRRLLGPVAPLAACVLGPRDRPLCAKRVVASLHVNLAIRSDNESVARTSRQILLPTTDDETRDRQSDRINLILGEEPKDFGVVVLADLDPATHGR